MIVKEVKGFSSYDYKDKKYRGFELVLDNGKEVKRSILESEPMIMVGDEFPESEYEIVEAKDKNENVYFKLMKKQKENGWSGKKYEKKEVNPRAYLINTCLPSVLPEILSKKLCIESFFKVMEQCLDWVDGNYKFSELSPEQLKSIHALLAEYDYKHEDIHALFTVESSKQITLDSYNSFMRKVKNMPKDEVKKFLKEQINA